MSPVEVSQRLADRFTLLTSGARTAEERQQTLRATVDWSYQLLSAAEQRIFDRLSVFQGGWTLMSAEAVVGDESTPPGEVLNTVGRLVERSMVAVEPGPTTRYRMLETLRHYAAERLQASGTGAGGASPRRLLPRASSSTPRSRCVDTSNGRRCGSCATSNPTSAPLWPSSAAQRVTATRP